MEGFEPPRRSRTGFQNQTAARLRTYTSTENLQPSTFNVDKGLLPPMLSLMCEALDMPHNKLCDVFPDDAANGLSSYRYYSSFYWPRSVRAGTRWTIVAEITCWFRSPAAQQFGFLFEHHTYPPPLISRVI